MSFDPRKFWYVGNHLKRFSSREEYKRTAVSRYYYASFLYARDYYKMKTGKNLPQEDSHKFLIDQFKKSKNKKENKIGSDLLSLKFFRIRADYRKNFKSEYLGKSKVLSTKIINSLNKLMKN